MLKNKKALTIEQAIYLVFAAFLLIAGTVIAYRIYSAFTSERDDGSLANFEDRLVPKMQELVKNNNKLDYTQINYFIGAAAVVGYNKIWDSEQNKYVVGLKIEKPSHCSDKACLCFFKQDSVLGGKPYKPCIKFDKVTYFLKDTDASIAYGGESEVPNNFYDSSLPSIFNTEKYKYFHLDLYYLKQKSQPYYIEKYQNANGEVIVYVAPINDVTRDKINQRKAYIDSVNKQ